MNNLEKEVIEIAIAAIIANRTKASHGESRQDIFGEDPKPEDFESDPVVKAAASVAMKWAEKFYRKGQEYPIMSFEMAVVGFELEDSPKHGLTPTEHPKQKEADQGIGNWQKCPLCIGSGEILATGFIDSGYVRCPTCDGKKIISTLTGQPPTEPDTKEPA